MFTAPRLVAACACLAAFLAACPELRGAISTNDAAVWLTFTNASGSVANDDSRHGNHGSLGASASFAIAGGPTLPGGATLSAVDLSGAADAGNSVIIGDSASMDFNKNETTIVFWAKPDALPDRCSFIKTDNLNSSDGMDLQKHRNSISPSDVFVSPKGFNNLYNTTNKNTLVIGQWKHIAVTWNWNGGTNFIRWFINGTTNTHQAWFGAAHPSPQGMSSANWYLGWDPVVSGRPFDGRLADFAIFTNTLTPNQIFQIYSNGVASVANALPDPPADTNAPDPVTSLTATGLVLAVDLAWTNPTNTDFTGVLILRRAGSPPTGSPTPWLTYTNGQPLGDGTVVYAGPASNATPGAASAWLDLNPVLEMTNHYSVFAYDAPHNFSPAATADALPIIPDTPPDPVTALLSLGGITTVDLSWINPTNTDFTGVLILRSQGAPPNAVPTNGQIYGNGDPIGDATVFYRGGSDDPTPGAPSAWQDDTLPPAGIFCYSVFAYDAADQYSIAATTCAAINEAADSDGDTMTNAEEYEAGTDPLDSASYLLFVSAEGVGPIDYIIQTNEIFEVYTTEVLHVDGIILGWPSTSNRIYDLYSSTNLVSDPFVPLATGIPATPPLNVYTTSPGPVSPGFYRLQVTTNPPPP